MSPKLGYIERRSLGRVLCLVLIAVAGAAGAQDGRVFVTNEYFTFGDPDGRTAAISLADFDGDGDLDAFVANGRHWAQQDYVYLNAGFGRMLTAIRVGDRLATAYKPTVADFDQDGDPDIFSLRDRIESNLFMNDGDSGFSDAGAKGVDGPARSASVADFDKNGRQDVLISQRSGRNYVIYDVGRRSERIAYIDQESQSVRGDVADFDGDGFTDAVFANIDPRGSYVILNDRSGALVRTIWLGPDTAGAIDVIAADFDNDGDKDIALGAWDRENQILLNEGGEVFSRGYAFGPAGERTYGLATADFNGDGRADIAVANYAQANAVYLAQGAQAFFRTELTEDETALSYGVSVGDVNGDGSADLVFANSGAMNRIYLNVLEKDAAAALAR